MTRLWWARHGQSEANVSHTFSHRRYDPPLTDLGRRQATDLAERVASLTLTGVYCSPMTRTRQTAHVVTSLLDLPAPVVVEELRELDVGSLDGRADEAGWRVHDEVLAGWAAGRGAVAFPDGESLAELLARLGRALQVIGAAAQASSGAVLVVAHTGNLRAALTAWGSVPPEQSLGTGRLAELDVAAGPDGTPTLALRAWDL